MNSVEPIKDKAVVNDITDYLKLKNDRDALLFMFGIYTGLRISDIIKLRVRDVRGRDRITVKETKTGKDKIIKINHVLRKSIASYVQDKKDYEVLFKSRNGINKPISRQQAYNIINSAGKHFGMECIGTHTMRKTFGYHIYQKTKDITLVQKLLNHSTPEFTLAYIGMTQKAMEDAVENLDY
ncbi:MAG: tyrosine-type recombinase/integrase [Lachnospiraceae bacterium]